MGANPTSLRGGACVGRLRQLSPICLNNSCGVPADDVARSVWQQPGLQLAASRPVPTHGANRTTVACGSALVQSTRLSRRCPPGNQTKSTAFRSHFCALRTRVWNQRLEPLGHAISGTPRNVLPDDNARCTLRMYGRQLRGSDSHPCGPSLGAAVALGHSAKLS